MIELAQGTAQQLPGWLAPLVVIGIAGLVSAAGIVQETRTTSLLLSPWAAFLAGLAILLDIATAALVIVVVDPRLPGDERTKLVAYISIAALAPGLLRGLQVPIARTSVGPLRPYEILRGALLARLDDEFGTRMEMKSRLIAHRAYELAVDPDDLAHVMVALVKRGKPASGTKAQIGHILGALQAGDVEDQMQRLVELMYEYRLRALIRCIETGTITALLTPSRPVYLVHSPGEPPQRTGRATPRQARTAKAARSRPSPRAPAPPDPDPQAPGRSGRQGQEQDPQGS